MLTWRTVGVIWLAVLAVIALLSLYGCAAVQGSPYDVSEPLPPASDWPDDAHNDAGGFIGACGDLPGMLGDDC